MCEFFFFYFFRVGGRKEGKAVFSLRGLGWIDTERRGCGGETQSLRSILSSSSSFPPPPPPPFPIVPISIPDITILDSNQERTESLSSFLLSCPVVPTPTHIIPIYS